VGSNETSQLVFLLQHLETTFLKRMLAKGKQNSPILKVVIAQKLEAKNFP